MNLPFTIEQFLGVFALYNTSIWPMQLVLNLAAIAAIILAARPSVRSKIVAGILGVFWCWTGVVYHLIFFSEINGAAVTFGILFLLQGVIFFYSGVLKSAISFRLRWNTCGYVGAIFLLYALIIYPLLGHFFGHTYPYSPTFGAPCPTTIFTFGLLLWTDRRVPVHVYIIPTLWSLLGFSAAASLGIWEDLGLVLAGIAGATLLFTRRKFAPTAATA